MKLRLVASPLERVLVRPVADHPHIRELDLFAPGLASKDTFLKTVLGAIVDDSEVQAGHFILLRGRSVLELVSHLAGDIEDYQKVPKIPGRKEQQFTFDGFECIRRELGSNHVHPQRKVVQFEFRAAGATQSYVATLHYQGNGQPVILIIPKKTILVAGHGTIASKVRYMLQKLGFEVYVMAHTAGRRSRTAMEQGVPIILHPESEPGEFDRKEIPYVYTFEDAMTHVPFDMVVEGMDGTAKSGNRAPLDLQIRLQAKGFGNLPVVYQGGNELSIAPRVVETQLMEILGLPFNFREGIPPHAGVFMPSCNTHQYLHILAGLYSWNKQNPGNQLVDVELRGMAIRRTGDTGSGRNDASPDGSAIDIGYHHAPDALAWDVQLPPETRIHFAKSRDGKPVFRTDATFGPQQRYHIVTARLKAKKTNGEYLTAEEYLAQLKPLPRVAVVKFEGRTIEPTAIHDVVANQLDLTHPYLEVITAQQDGDEIVIIGLTYQESNVVLDNIATTLNLTGLVSADPSGVVWANDLTNMAMGLPGIKSGIEAHSPFPIPPKKKK